MRTGLLTITALGAALGAAVLSGGASQAAPIVVDGINADKTTFPSAIWEAFDVGWLYTPAFAYELTGVETIFDAVDGRSVTLEIYSEAPDSGNPFTLLASAAFTPVEGVFSGATFASFGLDAGEDYFIAFLGVRGLGGNITGDDGAVVPPGGLHFSEFGPGLWDGEPEIFTVAAQPILRFLAADATALPVPGALALLGFGLAGLAAMRRRQG